MSRLGSPAARYALAWIALLVLTVVTVVTGKMDLGAASLPVALAIALVKGAIVVLLFMHLLEHPASARLVFLMPLVFIAVILVGLYFDVGWRYRPALPADLSVEAQRP